MLSSFLPKGEDELVLRHKVRQAEGEATTHPAVILLHGYGSNEQDLFGFAQQIPKEYTVISARAPITLRKNSYAWYHVDFSTPEPTYIAHEAEKSRKILLKFIKQVTDKYKLDTNHIILSGFSQGGVMSYAVATQSPEKIKGIGVLSGKMLKETTTAIKKGEALKKLKVFISHGKQDPVIKIHHAHQAKKILEQNGLQPEYLERNQMGHSIDSVVLLKWLTWLKSL